MNRIKLGCQTITFGEQQSGRFPEVFGCVAEAGYEGVEIGFRHIQRIPAATLKAQLDEHALTLVATHVGGNLLDLQSARNERRLFDEVADYLAATGTRRLMYSGLTFQDEAQFSRDLELLVRIDTACRERGLQLLYHNHYWEFADGGHVINEILRRDQPALGLCVDVGWVMKGGEDPVAFLTRARDRIGALHFKDFKTPRYEGSVDTVELGRGVAPLSELAAWLKRDGREMWVIAEQDFAVGSPEAAVRANAEYLRQLFMEGTG